MLSSDVFMSDGAQFPCIVQIGDTNLSSRKLFICLLAMPKCSSHFKTKEDVKKIAKLPTSPAGFLVS